MEIFVYFDSINGVDGASNDGTESKPFKTLDYFTDSIATKDGQDYILKLSEGNFTFQQSTFADFQNCTVDVYGERDKTILKQVTGLFSNNSGGYTTFNLTFRRLIYNIDLSLTTANLNNFNWNWTIENVVFDEIPDNGYSVLCPINGNTLIIKNSTKVTNSAKFLRTTHGTINVYDSYGAFTSGYGTSDTDWNISGNDIILTPSLNADFSRTDGIETNGVYNGENTWNKNKVAPFVYSCVLFLSAGNEIKSLENGGVESVDSIPTMISDNSPNGLVTASSYYGSDVPYLAFDDSVDTGWYVLDAAPVGGHWLQYEFNSEKNIRKISLVSFRISGSLYSIKSFDFYGSNDGISYNLLFSDVHPNDGSKYYYNIENKDKYKIYKIVIPDSYYDANHVGTTEMEMFEGVNPTIIQLSTQTEQDFIDYGVNKADLPNLNFKEEFIKKQYIQNQSTVLGNGKTFSQPLDLVKYKVNKISFQ